MTIMVASEDELPDSADVQADPGGAQDNSTAPDQIRLYIPPTTVLSGARIALVVCLTASVLAVWFLLYATVLTGLQEHGSQSRLYEKLRVELAEETAPISAPIRAGAPVIMLSIPAAGIGRVVVVEGTTAKDLSAGPGHLSDTPLPGQSGVSVVYGRSYMFGGPFRRITDLKLGDTIAATTAEGTFSYKVRDVRYPGDALPQPLGINGSDLTLVTSASHGWRSGWAPGEVVYVDATLSHGKVSAPPAGLPARLPAQSEAMQGDANALVPFIFWMEGLLVVVGGFLWAWRRWSRIQTWVVGVPAILAVLWGASGAVALFLPNLV